MLQLSLSEIKRIEAIVQSSNEYISLSQGAIRIDGISQQIKDHLKTVLDTDKTDYYQSAWGIMPLREKLANQLSLKHNCSLTSKNMLISHGCMGAISAAFLTILEPGDEVILPNPTYPAYKNAVEFARAKAVFINCPKIDNSHYWNIDIEAIKAATTDRTKIIIFSNPCNPLGSIVPKNILFELKQWCEQNKIYLISDESYDDYIFEGEFYSATALVPESEWVIRMGSYSKSLAMSGWRVGFMVVPDHFSVPAGIAQDALLNCPNVFAQHAVMYALDHPEIVASYHTQIRAARDLTISILQPLVEKGILSFNTPPAGFYLFLKTQEKDSFNLCMDILNNAKVGLIPGNAFGPIGASSIRLCYARKLDVLQEGLSRIVKFFDQK